MKPTWPKIGATLSATSPNSASTMNACGCTGPPTKTGPSAPGRPSSSGTASTAGMSEGRLSTSPIAPSSSWCAIRTTVLRKFGSISDGDESSRCPRSDSTSTEVPPVAVRKRLQHAASDHHPVHFVRPVVDAPGARRRQHVAERRLVRQPAGAVHLYRAVDHVLERLRSEELDRRDLDARLVTAVDLVRGVEGQQPARLDLRVAVRDPVLHCLLLGQPAAEGLPLERVRAHQRERPLHLPEPAHHVVDPPGAEALLGDREPGALPAERVRRRDAHIGVPHLAVRRPPTPGMAEHGNGPYDLDPGRVHRDDD